MPQIHFEKEYGPDDATLVYDIERESLGQLEFDLEGIAEVRRKFFGTLYNTYSVLSMPILMVLSTRKPKFQ
jgi:isoleucyl-tRNA synthetase